MIIPLVSVNNAILRLGNTVVFNGLNFKVCEGESWALVGESGAGKSALLQVIAGKFHLSGGSIRYYFHEQLLQKSTSQHTHLTFHKMIGMVESRHHFRNLSNTSDFYYQQRYNSCDSEDALTVQQYLQWILPFDEITSYWTLEKVSHLLKLEELGDKQLIKLSNGETKRLMIAASLLKNPTLLLLDNPLTGLDVHTREGFNSIIDEIIKSGVTVIMATSPFEIPTAITHVAVLKDGNIVQQITSKEFNAAEFSITENKDLDVHELASLFNASQAKVYNWIVNMQQVSITYNDKPILKGISWQIKQGERWALLGPNGSGKSTLLSLINGDNPQAYANDIVLFDRKRGSGESIWDIKKKIGFVSPELYQYFPTDHSCLQVIESGYYDTMGLFRPSDPKKTALAIKWMNVLQIDKYARVLLKNIPASAQRLCLLARALIKSPTLLILDEPCQGMDIQQKQHFKMIIDSICEGSNLTLIYVTHYQHEIPETVDKVLKLDNGLRVN